MRGGADERDCVVGNTAFWRAYSEGALRSAAGHSVRDLKLAERHFAHRCSPLIYTPGFLALPEPLKARIFDLLGAALQDRHAPDRYSYLGDTEKRRIRATLLETHSRGRAALDQR